MRTEDLVASLAGDVRAVPRGVVPRRLALGMFGGGIVTMALIASGLGLRPDLGSALHGFTFWMKWSYAISIGVVAVIATRQLARPDAGRPRTLWWLAVPFALLAVLAGVEFATTPQGDWTALWMGQSWRWCTLLVAAFSLPIFAGLMLAFRHFAPTRLRLTGAVAGLASGACGAALYCLHCPEASAVFVFVWYSLGILAAAGIGALLGPRLLRW